MAERPIRVLLVDDHTVVRQGLAMILAADEEIEVVGEAHDGEEALRMVEALRPEVVVMDLSLPSMSGLEATREIRRRAPGVKVLVLTVHETEEYVVHALRAGAAGYVVKRAAGEELRAAIRAVARGQSYLHPSVTRAVLSDYLHRVTEGGPGGSVLTDREREIVKLVAEGLKSREIAQRLKISLKTVETHRANVLQKLGINDRVQLVRYAIREGLIEP